MRRKKYYYRNKKGELAWHDEPTPEYGKENVTRVSRKLGTNAWATGLSSVAAAVHSNQVNEFREDAKSHGFKLTESCATYPASSVSGLYFGHPDAKYFGINRIDEGQVMDLAQRKRMPRREVEYWLASIIDYDPN